MTFAKGLMNF